MLPIAPLSTCSHPLGRIASRCSQADTARALDASARGGLGAGASPLAASALHSDLLLQWCARNHTEAAIARVRPDLCSSVCYAMLMLMLIVLYCG